MIKKIINKFQKSESLRSIAIVISGTAISQLIAVSVTPILTRSYNPTDFGYFTTFIAFYTILSSFVTGKYERVILLADNEEDIKVITTLTLVVSILLSILVLGLIYISSIFFDLSSIGIDYHLIKWLYLMPVFLILFSINLIYLNYLNYQKNYKEISKSKIIKTLVAVSVSLLSIYFLNNMGGLILGELAGLFFSTFYLFPKYKFLFSFDSKITSRFYSIASRYKNFPLYNIPSDILNSSSSQLPVFFLSSIYGVSSTGQYSLMKRVLDAPITLFSSSILEVFRQKAAEQFRNTGDCRELFIKTAKNLTLISILPFLFLMIFGKELFSLVFGNEWIDAGKYACIFSVYYFFKFISSPLSYIIFIAEKQKLDFFIHVYMFISSFLIFTFSELSNILIEDTLWIYTINFVVIYLLYFFLSYKYSKREP